MLPAALFLLVLVLLIWAKMSNPQPREEEKLEQTLAEQPAAPTVAKPPAQPSTLAPNLPPQASKAVVGEQEQIVVYNPAALRRPALAKFVLGSFEDNSSDDELVAAAFRVGSRRSSLASVGGTGAEPPTMTAPLEPAMDIRYGAWGRVQRQYKDAPIWGGQMLFVGAFLRASVAKIGGVCFSEPQINTPVLPSLMWCCMKDPDNKVNGRTPGRADVSECSV